LTLPTERPQGRQLFAQWHDLWSRTVGSCLLDKSLARYQIGAGICVGGRVGIKQNEKKNQAD